MRCRRWVDIAIVTANTPHKLMTIAIGIAVPSCKIPTNDAAPAATPNWMQPSNAEALPARAPCPLMAHAEVFGKMQPRLAMQINNGTSNGHSASVRKAAMPSSVSAASR